MTASKRKKGGLGRGLDALLGPSIDLDDWGSTSAGTPKVVALDELTPSRYQPRIRMDEGALYELAESIRAQGIMQPVLVRPLDDDSIDAEYEIIAGERRYRAAALAQLSEIPVLVREVSDQDAAAMALIENMQREDLNPLEEAQGLKRLVDDFDLTHEEAAQSVGRSRSAASNLLRLLNLTEPVQTMLMAGDIEMGHARALLQLQGAEQITAAQQVASRKMNVRATEAFVRQLSNELQPTAGNRKTKKQEKSGDLRRVEQELSDLLTATVDVRIKSKRGQPRGELAIQFSSLDELNGLIERLRQS